MWLLHYQPSGYEVGSEMPVWLFLTVAGGLLTGLLLAMLIGFHLVESNAGKHCIHKKQQEQSSPGVFDSGQFCCLCGNARNRDGPAMTSSSGRTEVLKSEGFFQPFLDAAFAKLRFRYFGSQTSQRSGIVRNFHCSWLNVRELFRKAGRVDTPIVNGGDCPFPVEATACTESISAGSPVSASVDGSDADSRTTITTTITTTTSSLNSSAASSCGVSSNGIEKESKKQLSQRRLVLEILMSSSGEEMPRATRVRLKMETNTCLDNPTNQAAVASSGEDRNTQGRDVITTDSKNRTSVSSRKTSSSITSGNLGSASKRPKSLGHVPNQGVHLEGDCTSVAAAQAVYAGVHSADMKAKGATCMSDELECLNMRATGGTTGHGSAVSNKMTTGNPLASSFSFSSNTSKSKQNGHSTSTAKLKPKVGCPTPQCSRLSSALPTAMACSVNSAGQSVGTCRVPASQQSLNNLSLDGLGSLRISLLDAGVKGKSLKECSKGVPADIASALAALNVDSIAGKGVSMVAGTALGAMMTEAGKAGSSSGSGNKHSDEILLDEETVGEGSGSEQGINEGEEHQPLGVKKDQGRYEDYADEKKEKKKRKNRGRRHKGKSAVVSGTGYLSTDLRDSEKPFTERGGANSVAAASEVELGCICGATKGGCHSSGCPYPFTSSGSMVQRKIKEQYDELVRSNAAKTLTLAQVGRFTTCLVEAKVALQQKSETIQRRFTIAKSLLAKADKSSFDRLCGQIYGLENEQKKLEEDTVVYNRLQEQLKLSPAYLKMLEYGRAHFELQPNTGQLIEKIDSDGEELSFEELLAQEKKDSFWQKHGPARSFVQPSHFLITTESKILEEEDYHYSYVSNCSKSKVGVQLILLLLEDISTC